MTRNTDLPDNFGAPLGAPSFFKGITGNLDVAPATTTRKVPTTFMVSSQKFVNITPTIVVASSKNRRYLLLQNTGGLDIFLGFGSFPDVLGSNAIILAVNTSLVFDAGIVPNNEIYAVATGASSLNIVDGTLRYA